MPPSSPTTDPVTSDEAAMPPVEPATPGRWQEPPSGMLDLARSHPIAEVAYRRRAQVGGRVRSIRVRPWGEVPTLEAVIADETAAITVAFLGRRSLGGVQPGSNLTVEGMVGQRDGKLVILNPAYRLGPTA
jgi:RecG-like helicase